MIKILKIFYLFRININNSFLILVSIIFFNITLMIQLMLEVKICVVVFTTCYKTLRYGRLERKYNKKR